jgi:hypothetical protein
MGYIDAVNTIRTAIESLQHEVMFGHGGDHEFNQMADRKYPLVWSNPIPRKLPSKNSLYNVDRYTFDLYFFVKGRADDQAGLQNERVDFSEEIAVEFLASLDDNPDIEIGETIISPYERLQAFI